MNVGEFLGLESTHNPLRWLLPISSGISTVERFMFGGCGLGAAILAMESVTGRNVVWATAQYLSFAKVGEIMDLDVTVAVSGRYTAQARAIGSVNGREILTVNAAFGARESPLVGQYVTMPELPSPEECEARQQRSMFEESVMNRIEARLASGRQWNELDGSPNPSGRSALWVRMPELAVSASGLAILGDYVPFGISQAVGSWVRSNSLDNTIRVAQVAPSDWVLLDVRIDAVHHGFGHGSVYQWAEDGTLLATASQSAIVRGLVDLEAFRAAFTTSDEPPPNAVAAGSEAPNGDADGPREATAGTAEEG